jgi:hypothetical protein
LLVEDRAWLLLVDVRLVADIRDARLVLVLAAVDVAGVVERTRDVLDGFFCNNDVEGAGLDSDETEDFLRNCSVDEGDRSCD